MERLTEKQERILQFIIAFVRENGVSPTIREIMKVMGFSSPRPVQDHLKILQRKGLRCQLTSYTDLRIPRCEKIPDLAQAFYRELFSITARMLPVWRSTAYIAQLGPGEIEKL